MNQNRPLLSKSALSLVLAVAVLAVSATMAAEITGVASQPPERLRVLLGYAGWGPGQLESELSQGAWLFAPIRREVVFDVELPDMWEYVVRSLGIDPATLVPTRGIH